MPVLRFGIVFDVCYKCACACRVEIFWCSRRRRRGRCPVVCFVTVYVRFVRRAQRRRTVTLSRRHRYIYAYTDRRLADAVCASSYFTRKSVSRRVRRARAPFVRLPLSFVRLRNLRGVYTLVATAPTFQRTHGPIGTVVFPSWPTYSCNAKGCSGPPEETRPYHQSREPGQQFLYINSYLYFGITTIVRL